MDEPADAIPEECIREEKGALEAIPVVAAPEQLVRRLGLGSCGEQACPSVGSATQVMLSMPFRDTVGQNSIDLTEVNSTDGHPSVMSSVRLNPVQEKWSYPPWPTASSVQKNASAS